MNGSLSSPARRVVVTGIGAITPLGRTLATSWQALCDGASGVTSLEHAICCQGLSAEQLDQEQKWAKSLPCQVAAPVYELIESDFRTARMVQLAFIAGDEAMQQSQLVDWLQEKDTNQRQERVGVSMGTGMSSIRDTIQTFQTFEKLGLRKISPHFVPKVLSNSVSGRLSMKYELKGPNLTYSTACAAAAHAIGEAYRCIQRGDADIMLAGGSESCIDPLSMAGFCRLRALSTATKIDPQHASRPFDIQRDGFVMAEGSCILVLEDLHHARARQAHIIAEVAGYASSSDAFHITAPDENGRGAKRAMQDALHSVGLDPKDIGYVNAHATSTPKGDAIESRVIDECFNHLHDKNNNNSNTLYVSSTKGATGHLLGAAGAIEAAFTIKALENQCIPPTLNLEQPDETNNNFEHVKGTKLFTNLHAAMSNSFGFGGANVSLLFKNA